MLLGCIVNTIAVFIGGGFGLILRKGLRSLPNLKDRQEIPERIGDTIMSGLALCVLFIGIQGALKGENVLIAILSIAVGSVLGECMNLDRRVNRLGDLLQQKLKGQGESSTISQGFVTASLLFCVGAMAIVGSLQSGMSGSNDTLFTKSLIDGISAIVLASSLGFGVLLSGGLVFLYEGLITLLSTVIAPYLTTSVINNMTCVGSLLIIGIAFNMLKITKLKVMNYVPSVFLPILFCLFIK